MAEVPSKYGIIAKILAKIMYYENWKADTPNKKVIIELMKEVGLYGFDYEDDLIKDTQIDEGIYNKYLDKQ